MQFFLSFLQDSFAWLLFLFLVTAGSFASAESTEITESVICDREKERKVCLEIKPSFHSDNIWLWVTTSECKSHCTHYHNDFVEQYHSAKELPAEGFGMELYQTEQGDSFIASCSINKNRPPMPATIHFPVTKNEFLNTPTNISALLNDLVRISPDKKELSRRSVQILAESNWIIPIFTHSLVFLTSYVFFICRQL